MFSSLNSGMIGCVRRLEINDKYYNLGAAMHGGDIIAGQDISKWYFLQKKKIVLQNSYCHEYYFYFTKTESLMGKAIIFF